MKVRIMGKCGVEFETTIGSPQGDSLSPVLFNYYYEAALRAVRPKFPEKPAADAELEIPSETQYADDLDFIGTAPWENP